MAAKIITTPEEIATLQAYARAKADAAKAAANEAAWKDAVVTLMAGADEIVVNGETVATYGEVTSQRFDVTGVKKGDPETYRKWLVESVSRRFLWKGISA